MRENLPGPGVRVRESLSIKRKRSSRCEERSRDKADKERKS